MGVIYMSGNLAETANNTETVLNTVEPVIQFEKEHYKADGTIDKRYGEKPDRRNDDGFVQNKTMKCLYNNDEIQAVYNVFAQHVKDAKSLTKERAARRYLTMYVAGINLGLRGGDLCRLKWKHIFDSDWNFMYKPKFRPEKTNHEGHGGGKEVELTWSSDFIIAMREYLDWLNENVGEQSLNDYCFASQRTHVDEKTGKTVNYINPKEWWKVMERTRKEAGISQKVGTHGLRKTMVHSYIENAEDRYDAKIDMQEVLGHSSMRVTEKYACTSENKISDGKQNMACLYSVEN